jgi:dimethylaniline monooxygenase (N-oxide forming)
MCFQVYLSTRRGAWILNRVGDNGWPLDLSFNRILNYAKLLLPFNVFCSLGERALNQRFNHSLYNLKPKHR